MNQMVISSSDICHLLHSCSDCSNPGDRCRSSFYSQANAGIVPRLTPTVRPLIRISAGKARFNTPRLAAERIQLVRGANLRAEPHERLRVQGFALVLLIPFIIGKVGLRYLNITCQGKSEGFFLQSGMSNKEEGFRPCPGCGLR